MKLKTIVLTMYLIIMAAYNAHAQTQTGYRIPSRLDIGGGRMTGDMWCQYGTNGVRFKIGTQAVTQVGTVGVINGTNATGLPSLDFTYGGGSMSANFNGFNAVYVAGSQVGTSGALTGKLDAVGGVGTNNTFNNPTLAGVGTITASFGANGLVITPAEYASVNNATGELQSQITTATGSITNHTHTGSDGTTQIAHNSVTGTGTNSHAIIDTFIASKASASGLASLDGSSLVVQNPANATNSPTASKIPISLGTGFLNDSWLSSVISKLGQTIEIGTETTGNTDNISEGNTNKYYTDARVIAAVGSLTANTLSDVNINMNAENDFVKIVGNQLVAGSSSVSVAFSEVTGSATASQLPLISSLLGSATSAQLPTVIRLPGTTTNQAAQAYGQLYVQSSSNTIAATGTHTISGGTASASNAANGAAANAFDNNTGTLWETGNPGFPIWIQYQFTETKIVDTIRIWNYSNEWGTFTVQASNNGSTFDNFGNFMHGTNTDSTPQTYTFSNGAGYTYWRLNHTSNPYRGDSYSGIREVQFAHTQNVEHTQYSAKYLDPVTGNAVYEILTPGTATTQASYIYCNATTTVFGLGTNTAITATSTAYSGWFAGAVRATAFNVASTEKIKENIKPIKIKPDLLDAEGLAKLNYITNNKIAWIAANGGSYTTVINETGTGSVLVVDTDKMESDYNNYIELEWASDMNQDVYTDTIQKTHEKKFWQMFDSVTPKSWNPKDKPSLIRKGFVVETMPDMVKGDDGQSIDPMALIAYISVVQQTLKADTIFSLETLKELIISGTVTQQKIDYVNDRLEVLNP